MPLRHLIALIVDAHPDDRLPTTDDRFISRPPSDVRSRIDFERPACFIRSTQRRGGHASPGSGVSDQMFGDQKALIAEYRSRFLNGDLAGISVGSDIRNFSDY